jgi:hypothetical protein
MRPVLNRLDRVGDLHQLAGGDVGTSEPGRCDELHAAARSSLSGPRDLEKLKLALQLAEVELKAEENAHRDEKAAARKVEVNRIALLRIEAARQIDQACSSLEVALQSYQALGKELWALCADPVNMSLSDQIEGLFRVAKALPRSLGTLQRRLPGVDFGGGEPIAKAEAFDWGVLRFETDAA